MHNKSIKTPDEPNKFIITFETVHNFSDDELKRIMTNALRGYGINNYTLAVQSEKDFNDNRVMGGEGILNPQASFDSLFGDDFSDKLKFYQQ